MSVLEIIRFIEELIRKEYKGNDEISHFYLISLITKAVMCDEEEYEKDLHNYIIKKFNYLDQKTHKYMISIVNTYIILARIHYKKEHENLENLHCIKDKKGIKMKKESLLEHLFFRQEHMFKMLKDIIPSNVFNSGNFKNIDEIGKKLNILKDKQDFQSLIIDFDFSIKDEKRLIVKFEKNYEQIINTDIFNDSMLQKTIIIKVDTPQPLVIENINIENDDILIRYVKKSTFDGISYAYDFYIIGSLDNAKKIIDYILKEICIPIKIKN